MAVMGPSPGSIPISVPARQPNRTQPNSTKEIIATLEAAEIMLETIRDSGRDVGFKAAGGIRTTEDAKAYLDLAARIMGEAWISPAHFRFGASGLLDALLATLEGDEAKAPGDGY